VRPALVVVAVALGAALVSMLGFALGGRGRRDADAQRKGSRLLLGLADFLIHWFMWAIGPLERLLVRAGATPDHMNASGLVLGVLAGVLLGLGHLEAGGGVLALAGACDVLDGRLARARGVTSPYGKFIDSTLDRFVETFAFLGLVAFYHARPLGAFLAAAALGGSLLVSYAQARGETVNVSGSGGLMQRAERLVLTILGCLLDRALSRALGWPAGSVLLGVLALIAAGSLGTAVYRTVWIARQLRKR
jgi:CDP-diacylglycerol--glycerol-3-phosphate 3-phosphatidyltransferase